MKEYVAASFHNLLLAELWLVSANSDSALQCPDVNMIAWDMAL